MISPAVGLPVATSIVPVSGRGPLRHSLQRPSEDMNTLARSVGSLHRYQALAMG